MRHALLVFFALIQASCAAPQDHQTIVRISSGPIVGTVQDGVCSYKGIPYAAPPVGDLRWKPPQAVKPWKDPRDCIEYGPSCPQKKQAVMPIDVGDMDEDCLYLNVWAPAVSEGESLPVMFWIHGGGLIMGSGSAAQYDGANLAKRGVVVIAVNYRLGRFGFFAHPELTAESPDHVSGNYGILDQILALKWVKQNVAQFGGDPGNVTIFGESAGAVSVCVLMSSPLARGLFHRAIAQSAYASPRLPRLDRTDGRFKSAHELGVAFAKKLGVEGDSGVVAKLRQKRWREILEADESKIVLPGSTMTSSLCIDGHVLSAAPGDVFAAGEEAPVPLIIGANKDEGTIFLRQFKGKCLALTKYLAHKIAPDQAARVFALYGVVDEDTAEKGLADFVGDWFVAGCRRSARAHARAGNPVRKYVFTREPPWATRLGLRSFHSCEITYVFGTHSAMRLPYAREDYELSDVMMGYWTRFATAGDPNGEGALDWPQYSLEEDNHIVFDAELSTGKAYRAKYCDFVDSIVLGP